MTPLTMTPPRGETAAPAPPRTARAAAEARAVRERRYGRTLAAGVGTSVLVHLIALLILGRMLGIGIATYSVIAAPEVRRPAGLEVIDVVEAPEAPTTEAPAREEPLRRLPPRAPERRARPAVPGARAEGEREGALTNAEKLQPREGDPRLWKDFSGRDLPEARAGFRRADSAVRAIVSRMLDSLSEEQRRAAVEWLSGDGEWGVTPEGIRIGGVTIPINLGQTFAEEGPRGREARQEARDLDQIRRQDVLEDAEAVREERREEMRERSREEAERREREARPPPDTTRALVPD